MNLAPNGKPSKLTPEQYKLVRLPEFKAWFGDWENDPENASKVVDENGEPLVAYHGTNLDKPIKIFKKGKVGFLGPGIYFTNDYDFASEYAGLKSWEDNDETQVYNCFLNIKNPLFLDVNSDYAAEVLLNKIYKSDKVFKKRHENQSFYTHLVKNSDTKKLIEDGYDGIMLGFNDIKYRKKKPMEFVVWESNKVKLSDGTNTKFDGNNPDIRYGGGGGVGYVSYRDKYNKKYGYEKNESHSLKEISKDTGVSNKGLQKIYNKGIGAFKTNPSSVRPNVKSKEQWAKARVYSAVMGGKAARVDAKELKMNNGGEILLAPNGKPSNLTAEQYRIVRTPAFKAWFGDWERLANATIKDPAIDVITLGNISKDVSKVVDENEEPLVVRHFSQSNKRHKIFKEKAKKHEWSVSQTGIYFTSLSAKELNDAYNRTGKGTLYEVFLNIRNLLDLGIYDTYDFVSDKPVFWKKHHFEMLDKYVTKGRVGQFDDYTEFEKNVDYTAIQNISEKSKNKILKLGYKGIWGNKSNDVYDTIDEIVVFNSNQIKLADGTNTTFDANSPDIRYGGGGVVDVDIPTYLYHTTPSNNFQKIKQNGLLVAFDNRIYFTKNLNSSIDIANQLHKAYKENVKFYHIWKIDTNKLTNPIFFKDEDYDNAVYITEPIPKNAIKYYESTKIKYADGGGYIGSCVDIGSSNKEVCEYFPNATIMAEYVGNPDENEWGKSKETTPKEFYKYVSKDDVPKDAINGEHTYHYIAQDGSNRDMNINETAIYFIYNIASDIHYFFKKTKHKTSGDLVNEPYISDNFQIGTNGAYEHTEENEIINQYADGVDLKKKLKKLKKPKGDCYYAAAQLVMGNRFKHLFGDNNITYIGTPYLVHAEVRGQGKIANIRFGHAWVEDDENIYDYSNGNEFVMPKEIYYAIGDIDNQNPLKYQKYTFEEARRKMVTTRHYGEWDLEVDC